MTISESTGLTYNGIHTSEFGIYKISTDSGLFDEAFLPNRSIVEEKIQGRDEPYFFGFEYEPTELPLSFYFEDGWDDTKLDQVVRWISQPLYKPLIFDVDPTRIFYCVYDGDPRILHAGLKQGYVTMTMRCNSPFSYTPVYEKTFTVDALNNPLSIEIMNSGHEKSLPKVTIEKVGNGDISIVNNSNGGVDSKITGLLDTEIVTIDSFYEDIETNLANTYRYNNFNNNFLELVTGTNQLAITGTGIIKFTYQFKRYI